MGTYIVYFETALKAVSFFPNLIQGAGYTWRSPTITSDLQIAALEDGLYGIISC